MRPVTTSGLCAIALSLVACQGEAEEAPDITEAIPLDEVSETTDGKGGAGGPNGGDAEGSQVDPSAGNGQTKSAQGAGSGPPPLPDTMESGSNPPDMTEPPAGSKVQRIGG